MFGRKPKLGETADKVLALARSSGSIAAFEKAIQKCYSRAGEASREEWDAAVATLAPGIAAPDEDRAWTLAFLCGALVEWGADPQAMEEPLLERLGRIVGDARRFHAACAAQMPAEPEDPDAELKAVAERLEPSLPGEAHGKEASEHWIWNEGVPADIPVFEGRRVVLLGAPSYLRTWAAQRAFGALRADLSVEARIPPEEVRGWLRRMAAG